MAGKLLGGRVAVVTGGARGIGKAIALSLAEEGARVVVNGLRPSAGWAEAAVKEIVAKGGQAAPSYGDVSDFEQAGRLIEEAVHTFGKVDILVNNAGVTGWKMPWEMSVEEWNRVVSISLNGTFNCTRHACELMREQNWGRIINCTSTSWINRASACHYAAAKAGVVGFTRAVAVDMAEYGVTCNAYAPYAKTDMSSPRTKQLFEDRYKAGQIGREAYEWGMNPPGPEGIGPFIAYLASDRASDITGKVFYTSGGKIGVFTEPVQRKTIFKKQGIWSVEELMEEIPKLMSP